MDRYWRGYIYGALVGVVGTVLESSVGEPRNTVQIGLAFKNVAEVEVLRNHGALPKDVLQQQLAKAIEDYLAGRSGVVTVELPSVVPKPQSQPQPQPQ